MPQKAINGKSPLVSPEARVAENATLAGDVTLAEGANIWYGAVLRADFAAIRVGKGSNVQDNAVLHVGPGIAAELGENVTVGHGAILHGCTVGDNCLIGMGAILLDRCVIGAGSIVAAGSLVTQGTVIPPNSMVMGSPAAVKREVRPPEAIGTLANAQMYCEAARAQLE